MENAVARNQGPACVRDPDASASLARGVDYLVKGYVAKGIYVSAGSLGLEQRMARGEREEETRGIRGRRRTRSGRDLRLAGREKSERSRRPLFMPWTNEPRHTRAQKLSGFITNLRTRPLGGSIAIYRGCLLSRYICALPHAESQIPRAASHPIYPSDVGDTAGPDSPQSPLLPVYCIA